MSTLEKGLLYVAVGALTIMGAQAVASAIHSSFDRVECALQGAHVCVLDDAEEEGQ